MVTGIIGEKEEIKEDVEVENLRESIAMTE